MPLGLGIGLGVGVPLILLVGVLIGIKLVGLCRQGLVEPIGRPNETGPTMHNLTFATGSVPELVLPVESRRVNMKPL